MQTVIWNVTSVSLLHHLAVTYRYYNTYSITITIYFINPSGELKLSFDRSTKNISQ